MKKTLVSILSVAAAVILAGCTEERMNSGLEGTISYKASIASNGGIHTRSTVTDGSVDLLSEDGDTIFLVSSVSPTIANGEGAMTRGTMYNTTGEDQPLEIYSGIADGITAEFTAAAYNGSTAFFSPVSQTISYSAPEVRWIPEKNYVWQDNQELTFYAYVPSTINYTYVANLGMSAGGIGFSYTVPESAAAQKDILLGYYRGTGGGTGTADIKFYHPLTAVKFRLGSFKSSNVTIKSISLEGVYPDGTVSFSAGNSTWSGFGSTKTDLIQDNLGFAASDANYDLQVGVPFIIIPQEFSSQSPVIIRVVTTGDVTYTARLTVGGWQAGKSYTYLIGDTRKFFDEPNVEGNVISEDAYNFNNGQNPLGGWHFNDFNHSDATAERVIPGFGSSVGALKLTNTTYHSDNSLEQLYYDLQDPLPRGRYKLTFYAKSEAASSELQFGMQPQSSESGNEVTVGPVSLSSEWTRKEIEFNVTFDGAQKLFFSFGSIANNAVFLDRISVVKIEDTVEAEKLATPVVSCTNSEELETSLTFSWADIDHADGYAISLNGNYWVTIGDGNSLGENISFTSDVSGNPNTLTLTGLEAGRRYTLYVMALGDGTNYANSDSGSNTGRTKDEGQQVDPGTRTLWEGSVTASSNGAKVDVEPSVFGGLTVGGAITFSVIGDGGWCNIYAYPWTLICSGNNNGEPVVLTQEMIDALNENGLYFQGDGKTLVTISYTAPGDHPEYNEQPNVEGNLLNDDAYNFNAGSMGGWEFHPQNHDSQNASASIVEGYDNSAGALKLHNSSAKSNNYEEQFWVSPISVPVSQGRYKLTFYGKAGNDGLRIEFGAQISPYDSNNSEVKDINFNLTTSWQKYEREFEINFDGVNKFYINFGQTVGDLYLDLISVVPVSNGGQTQLATPSNVRCTAQTTNTLTFSWDAVANASAYEVFVNGAWTNIGNVTSYTWSGLDPATTYTFRVRAVGQGNYTTSGEASCNGTTQSDGGSGGEELYTLWEGSTNSTLYLNNDNTGSKLRTWLSDFKSTDKLVLTYTLNPNGNYPASVTVGANNNSNNWDIGISGTSIANNTTSVTIDLSGLDLSASVTDQAQWDHPTRTIEEILNLYGLRIGSDWSVTFTSVKVQR